MEHARGGEWGEGGGEGEATSLKQLAGLNVMWSKPLQHLIQAFFERGGLLQGVRRRCVQLRTVMGKPLLVLLLPLGPVRFARAIGGHIESLDLVDVVVPM